MGQLFLYRTKQWLGKFLILNVLSIPNESEKLGQELAEIRQVKTGGCRHCWKKRKKMNWIIIWEGLWRGFHFTIGQLKACIALVTKFLTLGAPS